MLHGAKVDTMAQSKGSGVPAGASLTAILVCQGRAAAHGRVATDRFKDPVAARLLDPDELLPVEQIRAGLSPNDWRQRLTVEAVRACAEVVVPRTVAIDDGLRQAGHQQVVILGAGLDSRPWRLPELEDVDVFSVDQPGSQSEARRRSAGLTETARRLHWIATDLRQVGLEEALNATRYEPSLPTTWVWEGVIPYLRAEAIDRALAAIARLSAPGSALLVNYQAPSWKAWVGRRLASTAVRLSGRTDPLAGEPWRSTWTQDTLSRLLAQHRFRVQHDEDLFTQAGRLGSPAKNAESLRSGRTAVAVLA